MPKELYSTIIGPVVVSKGRIIDKSKMPIQEMLKKHRGTRQTEKVLEDFKALYPDFVNANIKETKRQIRESITSDLIVVLLFNSIEAVSDAINSLSKRLKLWVGIYLPVLYRKTSDTRKLVKLLLSKSRKELLNSFEMSAADSMGKDIGEKAEMILLAKEIERLFELKEKETRKLKQITSKVCPNTSFILGTMLTANLLKHAGSLKKLMEMPASTIQLLGAEKALFRHMKTGAKSPKHGIIRAHPLIAKSPKKLHGKISRNLADKISIAAKVDYFKGKFIGDKLKKSLTKKFGDY